MLTIAAIALSALVYATCGEAIVMALEQADKATDKAQKWLDDGRQY